MRSCGVIGSVSSYRTRPAKAPSVSIVMPAFNAENWISRAIKSVIEQTFSDWELVIVDDGSTDGTETVVRDFDDPRIQFIRQSNRGPYHSRNTGLKNSCGKLIALLDADDWYEPNHLRLTVDFLERNPQCSLVGTNFYFIDKTGRKSIGCKPGQIRGEPGDGIIGDYFGAARRNRCFPITNCAVFRRECIADLGAFDDSLLLGGDHEFWFRWAMRSQFGYIDEPTCYYLVDTVGSARKDLGLSIQMRVKLWEKLSAIEPVGAACWQSYARCKSFYLFRLTALSIAAGYFDEAEKIGAYWQSSPSHVHWWLGRFLLGMPRFGKAIIHETLGRTVLVKHRQGGPAYSSERSDMT